MPLQSRLVVQLAYLSSRISAPRDYLNEEPEAKDIEGAHALIDLRNNPKIFQCKSKTFKALPRRLVAAAETERTTRPTETGEARSTRDEAEKDEVFHLGDFYED